MRLQFFRVEPENSPVMFFAARNEAHCAEMFVTWDMETGDAPQGFITERFYRKLPAGRRQGLNDLMDSGITGIVDYDPLLGWKVRLPE